MARKLLVTGGAGFIGANFVQYWAMENPEDTLCVLDALTYAGNITSLDSLSGLPNFHFVEGNIHDTELLVDLLKSLDLDTLVHLAAESHVDRSIHEPDAFVNNNILGTYSLLKAARKVWLSGDGKSHRFHHVSTDEVYGSLKADGAAFAETNTYAPNSPYSASKAASDHLVRAWHQTYGLQVTTSVCSNNFGPYQYPEKLVPFVIINLLENKQLPVYGDGKQVRDWLYVADHVRGIGLILNNGRVGESYNIGGQNELANIEIVKLICRLVEEAFLVKPEYVARYPKASSVIENRAKELIKFVKDRPGHDRRYAIDLSKSKSELGYMPKENFEDGIRKTITWYLENESWWRSTMDGSYERWLELNYRLRV